jgi:UDP-glucose 4-epimerase
VSGFTGRKVLITGGLGFIGSHLAARLVAEGADVTIVDSLIPEYGGSLHNVEAIADKVRVNISDVRDVHGLRYLIQGQEYLFNLAGQTGHLDSMTDPETDLDINCRAQLSILETCRRYNPAIRVVFASTRQIYGRPNYLPVDEGHIVQPVDVNGINKAAGERYHVLYNDVYGVRASALRLTNTYGPHMRIRDARQTFLGIWIRRVLEGEPFEVWEGDQLRDFSYVDDAVDAFCRAASDPAAVGKIFNLGGLEVVSLRELAALLVKVAGTGSYEFRVFPEERRRIDIGDYYSDDRLIRTTLGWEPKVTLEEGLTRTVAFYRTHLPRYV